jgi:uncharacterized membrane protein
LGGEALDFLAFIIAAVAIVMAWAAKKRARDAESRLTAVEEQLARLRGAGDLQALSALVEAKPAPETGSAATPPLTPEAEPREPARPAEPEPVRASASPPPPPSPPPQSQKPARGFEERFGTQWVVWVGGVALALGGIFLVRYSIEAGLVGPKTRTFLGALLATALIAAGEWTRRNEIRTGLVQLPTAHIPSILTAAGTTVAYASIYAAFALYGFLSAGVAFILLAVVALATLGAALLHGPLLAGLGLVGAYVTPILASTGQANYWALYIYLVVVTAAACGLARMRMWLGLAITAIAFGGFWMLPGLVDFRTDVIPHAFHAASHFTLVAVLIVANFLYGPHTEPHRIEPLSSAGLIVFLFAAFLLVIVRDHDGIALAAFTLLAVATIGIAWRTDAATAAIPAAAALAALAIGDWAVEIQYAHLVAPGGPVFGNVPEPEIATVGAHLTLGTAFAVLFGVMGFLAQGRSEQKIAPILWAASAVFTPLAIMIALYYRIYGFDRSIPFAAIALLIAAINAIATDMLSKREERPGMPEAIALFAVGSVAALALALTFALEKGWLTVGLALMVPGIAYISTQRPLPLLRALAAAAAVLVLLRIGWNPRIVGADVGTTPIFNWLLYGYGVPALSFWIAGYLLRKNADDVPSRMIDSGAILFTVLLAFVEIRHYITSGDIYRQTSGLNEIALHVSTGLAMAIGLERLRLRTNSIVHNVGAIVVAALALAAIVLGLALSENPLFTGRPVGGPFFNLILLGYGLPAVLAIILALVARATRPMEYRIVAAVTAVGLSILYLILEVRRLYHGPVLTGPTSDVEQYTYSAVLLAYGVVLLLVGILLRSQPARLASAAVIILTVGKVFLFDLAGLTGIYRALSFIGLGLVLVGIGYLYQRLLFPPRPSDTPAAAAPPAPA